MLLLGITQVQSINKHSAFSGISTNDGNPMDHSKDTEFDSLVSISKVCGSEEQNLKTSLCGTCTEEHTSTNVKIKPFLYTKTHTTNYANPDDWDVGGNGMTKEEHECYSNVWCKDCDQQFDRQLKLVSPAQGNEISFACELCSKKYTSRWYLKQHVTENHWRWKPYSCNTCSRGRVRTPRYECHICKHHFATHGNLEQHLQIHLKDKAHLCNTCNRQFFNLVSFKTHLETHTEEKPIARKMYDRKKFPAITQSDKKTYICEVCGMKFTSPGHLKQHVTSMHTSPKPYSSDLSFEVHESSCGPLQRVPYECGVCKQTFTVYAYLEQHLQTHAKDKVHFCNTCNKKFFKLDLFKRHLEIHTEERRTAHKIYDRKNK
jgi:KRAB domain-containing zinc finger protein